MERDEDSEDSGMTLSINAYHLDILVDLSTGWLQCDPVPLFTPETFTLPGWLPEWFPWIEMQILPVQRHALGLGLFALIIAPLNIKDFGDSIPGHGGMTDRMACQMVMAVFACIYHQSFIVAQSVSVGMIFDQVLICEHVHKSAHSNGTCGDETNSKPEILLNIYDLLCFCVV